MANIYRQWPSHIADELASFVWPLRDERELARLFACQHAAPVSVCGGEFSGAVRSRNEAVHREVTISVDLRPSRIPGVHACIDFRLVLPMRSPSSGRSPWSKAYLFPMCTHQVDSDTTAREAKELDGRTFYGILCVIWCYCACAVTLLVEQPDTCIPNYWRAPTQRLRTSQLGDRYDKVINLYERGRASLPLTHTPGGVSRHGHFRDFADADARDRWRSSWSGFPLTALAVVLAACAQGPSEQPDFAVERERFAVAWHQSGRLVPADYDERDDGQPSSPSDREYQWTRGPGRGRPVDAVVPRSLRGGSAAMQQRFPFDQHFSDMQLVRLAEVQRDVIVLCFVAMQTVPLIFAAINGMDVIGAEMHAPTKRAVGLAVVTQWSERAIGALSSTFLVGEYQDGATLYATPLALDPPPGQVVRTGTQRRRRAAAGACFAWCTLAALAGTVGYDPAARAAAACSALTGPVMELADSDVYGHERLTSFSFGVFKTTPLIDTPQGLPVRASRPEVAMRQGWWDARLLLERLQLLSADDPDLGQWSTVIKPPQLQDVPPHLFEQLPTFDDKRLDGLAFTPVHKPPRLERLLSRPSQPPLPFERCPRSFADLMPATTHRRVTRWLQMALADLVCMRDHGVDCLRERPPLLIIAAGELYEWARHHVWDFRLSPAQCGTPLDYRAALRPTLNADFFTRELADYPNQRIVGMIESGVIYQADVELHSVFVPHLTSLPKGFKSVSKELRRLRAQGWNDFFPQPAFWPTYFNAQGSTSRKWEENRDRRTTEGGGPRKESWDRDGLRVWSINDAAKVYHVPQHYLRDTRPEMLGWMASRGLPPTPEQLEALRFNHDTKWIKQHMPTLRGVAVDFAVLRRAARLLNMPFYMFGNDVKDYFNHLENAPSELPLMNIVYLGTDDDLEGDARRRAFHDDAGNTLIFISERRMGFGIHPNSGIAQELSEAIDHIFRQRMDAHQDPINEADLRPSMQGWLAERRALERRVGGHQRRLYSSTTYCDDNIIGVVGVAQTIDAIRIRRQVEREAGLIMAIPEKRILGTWGVWLGIAIFGFLGLVVVPRHKLLRAAAAVQAALNGGQSFDDYRSLVGQLEHIRHATNWPRRIMHGLYQPHGAGGASRDGPWGVVRPNAFMARQLVAWLMLLSTKAGAAFTAVLKRASLPAATKALMYYASSDAATDSQPPGMAGYMHGFYWYLALTGAVVQWLHITVLELLASCFSLIIFGKQAGPRAHLALGADALATPLALTRHSQRSEMLIVAHHAALSCDDFVSASAHASIGHLRGDANLASDCLSRDELETFRRLCRDLRVAPIQLPFPPACKAILHRVMQHAIQRGIPVRPSPYQAQPRSVPTSHRRYLLDDRPTRPIQRRRLLSLGEQGLGRERRDRVEGDGAARDAAASSTAEPPLQRVYGFLPRPPTIHQRVLHVPGSRPHPYPIWAQLLDPNMELELLRDGAWCRGRVVSTSLEGNCDVACIRLDNGQTHQVMWRLAQLDGWLRWVSLATALTVPSDAWLAGQLSEDSSSDEAGDEPEAEAVGEPPRCGICLSWLDDEEHGEMPCCAQRLHVGCAVKWARTSAYNDPPESSRYARPSPTCYHCRAPTRAVSRRLMRDFKPATPRCECGRLLTRAEQMLGKCHICSTDGDGPPRCACGALLVRDAVARGRCHDCLYGGARCVCGGFLRQDELAHGRCHWCRDGPPPEMARGGSQVTPPDQPTCRCGALLTIYEVDDGQCSRCVNVAGTGLRGRGPLVPIGGSVSLETLRLAEAVATARLTPRRSQAQVALDLLAAQRADELRRAEETTSLLAFHDLMRRWLVVMLRRGRVGADDAMELMSSLDRGMEQTRSSQHARQPHSSGRNSTYLGRVGGDEWLPNTPRHARGLQILLERDLGLRVDDWRLIYRASWRRHRWCNRPQPRPEYCTDGLAEDLADGAPADDSTRLAADTSGAPPLPPFPEPVPLCVCCFRALTPEERACGKCHRCNADGDGPGRYAAAAKAAALLPPRLPSTLPARPSKRFKAIHAAAQPILVPSRPPIPRARPPERLSRASLPERMPTVQAGRQTFAAPASRKERAVSARKLSMLANAHKRARSLAGPNATEEQIADLQAAVEATHALAEFGAASGTLDKDDHAWVYWERFCRLYNWDPQIDADLARAKPSEICERLAIFQAWVYPQLSGRDGRSDAKPRTVFNNYVLAIVRVLNRAHVPMPKAKTIEKSLNGIMRSFKLVYGVEHLMPGRKQPLTPSMWARVEGLEEGARLRGRHARWSPATRPRDRLILRLGRVLWRTGHRLGEIVYHPSGEINYLTRSCVTIQKSNNVKISNPTAADWRGLQPGDMVLLAPCVSKSDQFGEEHCPFPSVLPHDGSDTSAAAAVRDIELELPCPPGARKETPLFCDSQLQPLTYGILHRELRLLLGALFGEAVAAAFSWHSVRIGLACSLHAAGCPDPVIQLICRWACSESLHVYRQMGVEKNVYWTERAQQVVFDATRVNNLPQLDRDVALLENMQEFTTPSAVGAPLESEPATPMRRPQPPAPLRRTQSYAIPGGRVMAHDVDDAGLVGLHVRVPRAFWSAHDCADHAAAAFVCRVAAECDREFRHPDGSRVRTMLIEQDGQFFPIKRADLVTACLTATQRSALRA